MSELAIRARGIGKKYRLAKLKARYKTLRESLMQIATAPIRALRGWAGEGVQEHWALRDVSFDVHAGEVVGLIGRNGAGKSTLLKLLSRITEPTQGYAEVRGRVGSLLEVGTGFHPELSGRENVYLNGAILGMKRTEINRCFDDIVEFAEIAKHIDTPVKHYSSGMYLRLAFAVAAHLEPEIMLVDEVLAVGDVAFQKKCLGKMGSVARTGRTVVFVSHNMQAIRQLCQRTIWLSCGQIHADGPSGAIVDAYLKDVPQDDAQGDLSQVIAGLPSDPAFRLREVQVLQDGAPTAEVLSGKPLEIRFVYDVLTVSHGLHVYLDFCDSEGMLLFQSVHNGDAEEMPTVLPGRYVSRATIPQDFLAPTRYELRFKAGIHNVRELIPRVLCMPLLVHASGRVNRAYAGYTPQGKIAPLIPWTTEHAPLPDLS